MATGADAGARPRLPLSRDRVLRAAILVADREGIGALTMRNLAAELGVEAMSLYHHVQGKDAVLDGVADTIVADINDVLAATVDAGPEQDWQGAMRRRVLTAREVLLQHPWAPGVIETRTTLSPAIVRYFDGVLGILRAGGFSFDLAHHALHAFGSRALGFTQELFAPADVELDEAADTEVLAQLADELPHLTGMLREVAHDRSEASLGWCDDQTEFEFGLEVLLDGLERRRQRG